MTAEPSPHRPRKRFGQHFLHDRGVIERIVTAMDPRPGDAVVEIGPGEGALTRALVERLGTLDVVELDRDLAAALSGRLGRPPGLRVHCADALEFDFASLARPERRLRVIGNLPYNVSTPLLFHLLDEAGRIEDLHLMLQREVVERLTALPGSRAYGRLTLMAALRCRAERLFTVGPGAFRPPPRVHSAVIRLTVLDAPLVPASDQASFARLVAAAFGGRRKTLRNSLGRLLDAAAIEAAGVDPSARAETIPLAGYAALARTLTGHERGSGDAP